MSQEHRHMALNQHKHYIRNGYIKVGRASGENFLLVPQGFLSKRALVIIRMRGLPYDCTAKHVLDFFATGTESCNILDGVNGILFVKNPDGRSTGDAFVLFANESDSSKALSRHTEAIRQRFIEVYSRKSDEQQILNLSMDTKTYESAQPPLITQIQPAQMPLLPQLVFTSGVEKSCIIIRGLPYEPHLQLIFYFLAEFEKNIINEVGYMAYNSNGQPSSEVFIQMDGVESARAVVQSKHNKYMIFGQNCRYIEVVQCSRNELNQVLNRVLHSQSNQTKPVLLSPGMLPQVQQAAYPPSSSGIPSPLALSIPSPNPDLPAQFTEQQNLLALQQAAAAAKSQPQYYLSNVALPPHPQTQQSLSFSPQSYKPQFFFISCSHPPQFPLGSIPHPMHQKVFTPASVQPPTTTSAESVNPELTKGTKLSQESAFRHDPLATSAPPQNFCVPFYPPTM